MTGKGASGIAPASSELKHAGATRREGRRLIDQWWQELSAADAEARPVANVFVMGSIAEVLRAFDIPMSFPEIAALQTAIRGKSMDYLLAAEDQGYSPDICAYVKVDVGLHVTGREHPHGRLPKPSLVVSTNMCNTYIKWSEIWERMYGCPLFVLDIPGWRGTGFEYGVNGGSFRSDCAYVQGQLRELIVMCEQVTGRAFDVDRLREVMGEVNRMSEMYREILAENKNRPAPFNSLTEGVVHMGVANAYRGHPEGSRFMEAARDELRERVHAGIGPIPDERFRLLFVGPACYTNFRRFVEMFEEWGAVFVAAEYASYGGGGLDRGIHYDLARPIESLAEQILLSSQTSFSGIFHSHQWQTGVVRDWSVDGICFHGVKSCRTTSTGLPDAREWLMRNENIPGLFIQSDLVDARLWAEAQLKNRIDAFFESLQGRKASARR
ncbi:MAG: 2-hydroxyacyl-CoA dehydratase [Acidobacteria bacterium]|nr:2-hydroxyacyl-CoA dehydratase [Acidobacteriota bacterium]